jgi:hypothetical protein
MVRVLCRLSWTSRALPPECDRRRQTSSRPSPARRRARCLLRWCKPARHWRQERSKPVERVREALGRDRSAPAWRRRGLGLAGARRQTSGGADACKAFSTPADSSEPLAHRLLQRRHLLHASSSPGCLQLFISLLKQICARNRSCSRGLGLVAVTEAQLLKPVGGSGGAGRRRAWRPSPGLCSSCISPAARVPSATSFSRCSASTW